ncbi:PAS domain-containing protein [Streptomyces sp. NPDC056309]|uniref:PAS domain-containing protein n=1 Tax=unclassified Streptomyces TaxID=2593676 RepID=UPI0035E0340B
MDERGILTGWSEGARLLLGHAPEEAVGRAAADLLAADVPEPTALAAGARQPWRGAMAVRHRDGRRLAVEVRLQPTRWTTRDGFGDTRNVHRPDGGAPTPAGRRHVAHECRPVRAVRDDLPRSRPRACRVAGPRGCRGRCAGRTRSG